jgi:hypothetical protein
MASSSGPETTGAITKMPSQGSLARMNVRRAGIRLPDPDKEEQMTESPETPQTEPAPETPGDPGAPEAPTTPDEGGGDEGGAEVS